MSTVESSLLQVEESQFVDSPHKVYVGNLAKTVTTEILEKYFSEKGKVLSAKVSRVPGTSKSSGFGFVTFSSDEDVETAITSFNNTVSCSLIMFCLNFKWKLGVSEYTHTYTYSTMCLCGWSHVCTSMNIVILAFDCCQTSFPAVMDGYRFFMFPFPPVKPLMFSDIT